MGIEAAANQHGIGMKFSVLKINLEILNTV